jgi:hypothetical protein
MMRSSPVRIVALSDLLREMRSVGGGIADSRPFNTRGRRDLLAVM